MSHLISVMVHTPAHSGLSGALTYESDNALAPGTLVRVPLGSRELLGVVWGDAETRTSATGGSASTRATNAHHATAAQPSLLALDDPSHDNVAPAPLQLRAIASVLDGVAPLSAHWRQLDSQKNQLLVLFVAVR